MLQWMKQQLLQKWNEILTRSKLKEMKFRQEKKQPQKPKLKAQRDEASDIKTLGKDTETITYN